MNSKSQIKIGAIISYIAIFINIVATIFYTPWIKNQLGIENYGLFTLSTSFIAVFVLDFGLGAAISRFLSLYRAEGNMKQINNMLGIVYKLYIAIDLIICSVLIVIFFFLESIYSGLTDVEIEVFKKLYIAVSAFSLLSFPFTTQNGILNSFERFVPLKICECISKILNVLFVVLALTNNSDLLVLVIAHSLSSIVIIIIKLIYIRCRLPVKANFRCKDKVMLKSIASFSVWTFVMSIAQRLIYNIAPSILGAVANSTQIALYSPASAINGYFFTFSTAINGLFLPKISKMVVKNEEDKILPLMIKVGKFQTFLISLMFIGFAVVGKEFIIMWMGEEFIPSYYCTLIISFPTIIEYSQQIANTTIIAKNKVKEHSIILLISAMVNLALGIPLSNKFGVYGVCVSICVAAFVKIVLLNILYRKKLDIDVFTFFKTTYLQMIIPFLSSITICILIKHLLSLSGRIGILINGIITVVVFSIIVYFIYLNKNERKKLLSGIKK